MVLPSVYGGSGPPDEIDTSLVQIVRLGDGPQLDAFDRLRVSEPSGIFESTLVYDKQPFLWNERLTDTGTSVYVQREATVRMTVTAAGDKVERQTRTYFRYQPGKSQMVLMTYSFGDPDANVRKRVGYFDSRDGIFLEEINGAMWIVKRSSVTGTVTDTRIPQASWNLDTFSAIDPTKTQLFCVDLEWLGVGRVRVGFFIDGQLRYAHEFNEQNARDNVYMGTAQLPARLEIEATGAPGDPRFMSALCVAIMAEGGQEKNVGFPFSARAGAGGLITVAGASVPILSVRPTTAFKGRENHVLIDHLSAELFNDAGIALVDVIYDGALTDDSFAAVDTESALEVDVAATAITGGTIIRSFLVGATNQSNKTGEIDLVGRLAIALDMAGASPTSITLAVTKIGSTSPTVVGVLSWEEYR